MFFTREDREKHEALAPVQQFAAQLEQKYGLHGRQKELAADIQAFLDSHVVFGEIVESPFSEPVAVRADAIELAVNPPFIKSTVPTEGEN